MLTGGVSLSEVRGSENWDFPEFPAVVPSSEHAILYQLSQESPGEPVDGSDKWDDDHVRLPCSPNNLYEYKDDRGKKQSRSRWEMIKEALQKVANKEIKNCEQLMDIMLSYNLEYRKTLRLKALDSLLNEQLSRDERHAFFHSLLPSMARLALELPQLIRAPIPLLKKHINKSVSLTQKQIACLLAHAFFSTYPLRHYYQMDSSYESYPFINFTRLLEMRGSAVWEKLKCIFHYFRKVCSETPKGVLTFCRRFVSPSNMPVWEQSANQIRSVPFQANTDELIEDLHGLIQVDFANKYLGGGVLAGGNVQEEIRFVICPELLISMLFTEKLSSNEAVIMIGVERYSKYSGYSHSFTWEGGFDDKTPYDSSKRRRTAVLAIDATPFYNSVKEYEQKSIIRELNKAWVGFSFFTNEKCQGLNYPGLATGNWGCGAFGGSPPLKSLIQLIACAVARRPMAYNAFGDHEFTDELYKMYECLVKNDVTVGQLYQHILDYARKDEAQRQRTHLFDYLHCNISSVYAH